jgi:ATP-dependent DNA helicase RecQ
VSDALSILQNIFGYPAFRGSQAEIIQDINAGNSVLTVMPTGAGKSLCFQIPALMKSGLAIVVSPLISLMQNQVQALQILGVEAASLNSNTSPEDNSAIWQQIHNGTLKLLYVSPERLMMPNMLEAIAKHEISLFAIDEAHCISQWGAAFRPEYEALSGLNMRFPSVPIIALTATADQATRDQILAKIFAGKAKTYLAGFDRPNISLAVEIKNSWKQQLTRFLKNRHKENGPENGIIYCLSRKKTEAVTTLLTEQGYNALAYHAGMSGHQRAKNLDRFMNEDNLIMVATIAFGMGIDKPDIRFVFHTDLPASPEAYYQEIGRAGRDGNPASAHMLYGMQDISMRRMFINNEPSAEDHKRREHQRLNSLLSYCEAPACRRKTLLTYFGDTIDAEACGNCDACDTPKETIEATTAGRKFLSAIARTGESFGVGHIVDILTGKLTPKIQERDHDTLPTFGVGNEFSVNDWKSIARQLLAHDFIHVNVEHGSLGITPKGRSLLKAEETFSYRPDVLEKHKATSFRQSASSRAADNLPDHAKDLFQALKAFRKTIAAERSVPAYIIFTDKSLSDMASHQPTELASFSNIHGVGANKLAEFGELFTNFIKEQTTH